MILQTWLQELRAANTEADVVRVARTQLADIEGPYPRRLHGHTLADGDDIREIAAELALSRIPIASSNEADTVQKMLLLFSLATDRLIQLNAPGAVRSSADRLSARGGRQQRP
jgi:hypothetical protein